MGTTAEKLAYLQETKNQLVSRLTSKLSGLITFDASKETFRILCTKYIDAVGMTSIAYGAFSNCGGVLTVNITDPVTSIGGYAFSVCRNLTSVTIGNSVTSIEGEAFYNCSELTSVTIGSGVTSIEERAFTYCNSIETFRILATVPPAAGDLWGRSGHWDAPPPCPIYVPSASVDAYKASDGWSRYAAYIEADPNE